MDIIADIAIGEVENPQRVNSLAATRTNGETVLSVVVRQLTNKVRGVSFSGFLYLAQKAKGKPTRSPAQAGLFLQIYSCFCESMLYS